MKWQPLDDYSAQRRGGRGKTAATTKEEDFVERLFVANTHDTVLFFSNRGKVYWIPVYRLPQATRIARGKPMVNVLPLGEGERISAVLPMSALEPEGFVLMATSLGIVKKTPAPISPGRSRSTGPHRRRSARRRPPGGGRGDGRPVRRHARGRRWQAHSIPRKRRARNGPDCSGRARHVPRARDAGHLLMIASEGMVLTATENGYGKCTRVEEYRRQGRAGQGIISIRTNERNGAVIGAQLVEGNDEIMLITDGGKLVRTRVNEVSVLGRSTQGVKLISLSDGERLAGIERIADDRGEIDEEAPTSV